MNIVKTTTSSQFVAVELILRAGSHGFLSPKSQVPLTLASPKFFGFETLLNYS